MQNVSQDLLRELRTFGDMATEQSAQLTVSSICLIEIKAELPVILYASLSRAGLQLISRTFKRP